MKKIKLAIIGVGNCASSLVQGIEFYRKNHDDLSTKKETLGLMNYQIGGYRPQDIEIVAAFDIDKRKVGLPVQKAIFQLPNCTQKIITPSMASGAIVQMGPIHDGIAEHMSEYPDSRRFIPSNAKPVDVRKILRQTGAEIAINYLPVGSQKATEYYAECCLDTGVSFVNCIPVFIASNPRWARRFAERGIPLVGDDVKSQVGATIVHRTLARLFEDRGVKIDRTYQLNTGGNTDFLNMLSRSRLKFKKISKTESVQSQLAYPLEAENIHIGPSDYVPWQHDRKVCFLRIEGRGFGDCPIEFEARLSVEDSPNSAGVTIDAIRCLRLARTRGLRGPLVSVSAWTMKHPPKPMADEHARQLIEAFIRGTSDR